MGMCETIKLLEISDLTVKYQTQTDNILSNLFFFINEGEVVLITGPTGCGKSTFLHTINGIIPNVISADVQGTIKFRSMEINDWEVKDRSLKIGTIFQDPESQLFALTVEEDVAFGPENLGLPREEIRKRVDYALAVSGLSTLKDRFIFQLSGGQKQRLAIGGILAMKPDLLLFDEPTADLDPQGTQEIISAIHSLAKEQNKGIVLIEHKLHDVIDIVDRVYIMNQGKFILEGTPSTIFTDYIDIVKNLGINIPYKYWLIKKRASNCNNSTIYHENLLVISNLYFKYGEMPVLEDLNLRVQRGEFIALLGRNGSGKTTLVQNIIGLLKPSLGNIIFKDEDTIKKKVQELAVHIGYLYQNPAHQIFKNTVYEELAFGLKNYKIKKAEIDRKIKAIAKKLELEPLLNRTTYTLSRGQSQRVALASILLLEPDLLILDEPTTGQDYRNRRSIMDLAKKLNEDGITIILITHDIDLAYEYAHRIIVLENGRIVLDGPPNQVFKKKETLINLGIRQPKALECV